MNMVFTTPFNAGYRMKAVHCIFPTVAKFMRHRRPAIMFFIRPRLPSFRPIEFTALHLLYGHSFCRDISARNSSSFRLVFCLARFGAKFPPPPANVNGASHKFIRAALAFNLHHRGHVYLLFKRLGNRRGRRKPKRLISFYQSPYNFHKVFNLIGYRTKAIYFVAH